MDQSPRYLIISPVKDEGRYIEATLQSVTKQTHKPVRWIIVDDGSTDQTPDIIKRYAAKNDFINYVRNDRKSGRQTGVAEVVAFNIGLGLARDCSYDFIVKLDGDLNFEPDYFERLLGHFLRDPRLGIASGVYLELKEGEWREIEMPFYHAAGASKVLRKECFAEIDGFITQRGWDTVDEIRAMARGWGTTHFPELKMQHLKAEGTGMGLLKTCFMHGEIYYRTGGGFIFFVFKVINRLRYQPFLLGGAHMLWGYIKCALFRKPLLVTREEARCYRAALLNRVKSKLARTPVKSVTLPS